MKSVWSAPIWEATTCTLQEGGEETFLDSMGDMEGEFPRSFQRFIISNSCTLSEFELDHFSRNVESYTFTIMTSLVIGYPLIFTFCQGASNTQHFREFVIACLPYICPQAIILGDNCSFHVQGVAADFAYNCFRQAGAAFYGSIPKYSPELNPEEKVNSKLKTLLRQFNPNAPLLASVLECLRRVTWGDVRNFYHCCNYL